MPHARVDAAAVWIEPADHQIVDADQRSQRAHRRDQPERAVTRDSEGQPDDVGLTRSPFADKIAAARGDGPRRLARLRVQPSSLA